MAVYVRKVLCLAAIGLLIAAAGFASGKAETGGTAAAGATAAAPAGALSWKQDTSPFTFDLFFYGAWGTAYPWKGSYVEKLIEGKTGVHPNIIVPTGDEKEYLSVLVASGKFPDAMILELISPTLKRLIETGNVYPIKDLTDKYAPEFWDAIPQEIKSYHAAADGKLYVVPSFFTSKEEWQQSPEKDVVRPFFIQKGIYEALGKPSTDTPDKLFAVLQTIKQKYPDRKPFSIEPPLDVNQWGFVGSFTLQYLLGAYAPETFGTTGTRSYYLDGNTIKLVFQSPGMVESLRFLNRLYRAGILSVDNLTEQQGPWADEVNSGIYGVVTRYPIDIFKTHNPQILKVTGDPGRTYVPLEYLKINGKDPQYSEGSRSPGWVGSVVMKSAKNPGRIIRYFEYSWSQEGQMDNLFGKLGETYQMVNGVPKYLPSILEEQATGGDAFWDKYGFERRLMMWRSVPATYQKLAIAPQAYSDYLMATGKYAKDVWNLGLDNLDPDPASPEGVALQRMKDVWNRTMAKMIIADSDAVFTDTYNAGIKEITDAGLSNVQKVLWDRHLADLKRKQGN